MDLRKLLASSVRQRILETLSESRMGELRVMQLVHKVSSPYNEVNRNLGILEAEGIVINKYSEPVKHSIVRVVKLNRENPKTVKLLQALKLLSAEKNSRP